MAAILPSQLAREVVQAPLVDLGLAVPQAAPFIAGRRLPVLLDVIFGSLGTYDAMHDTNAKRILAPEARLRQRMLRMQLVAPPVPPADYRDRVIAGGAERDVIDQPLFNGDPGMDFDDRGDSPPLNDRHRGTNQVVDRLFPMGPEPGDRDRAHGSRDTARLARRRYRAQPTATRHPWIHPPGESGTGIDRILQEIQDEDRGQPGDPYRDAASMNALDPLGDLRYMSLDEHFRVGSVVSTQKLETRYPLVAAVARANPPNPDAPVLPWGLRR